MLTKEKLENMDLPSGTERLKDDASDISAKDKLKKRALKIYRNELNQKFSTDLGLHGVTRAALRVLCKESVLKASTALKRRYSQSVVSSSLEAGNENNAISALRALQKERLIVSRLGFPDRAMELDREIDVMRERAKKARAEEENQILNQRLKTLDMAHRRKRDRLEFMLSEETRKMEERFKEEERKMLRRQENEFLRVIENATRRAIGRVKKCNCPQPYVCRHNKTASYNTRRPSYIVVKYRRNAKRLRSAGRPEESVMWDEKARDLDERDQEKWRKRVADSIVSSPWGANEAAVDQVTEMNKKELQTLKKTHDVKRYIHEKRQAMRRKAFENTMLAEERKVKMQCRKLALLRIRKDYTKERQDELRQRKASYKSDGLQNVSKNLLGENFDEDEKEQIDWVPPTAFGLDNSVRLIDAVNENNEGNESSGRIFTSFKDIQNMSAQEIQEKIHSGIKDDASDDDSESESESGDDEDSDEDEYKLGTTSGSKLVDRMRRQKLKREEAAKKAALASPAPSTPNTVVQQQQQQQFPANSLGLSTGNSLSTPTFNFGGGLSFGGWSGPGGNTNTGANSTNNNPGNNNSMNTSGGGLGASNLSGGVSSPAFPFASQPFGGKPVFSPGPNGGSPFPFPTSPSPFGTTTPPGGNNPFGSAAPISPVPTAPVAPAPSAPSFRTARMQSNPVGAQTDNTVPPTNDLAAGGAPGPDDGDEDPDGDDDGGDDDDGEEEEEEAVASEKTKDYRDEMIVQKVKVKPYEYDPFVDDVVPSFAPGSVLDADWKAHDEELEKGTGQENSFGISLVLPESPRSKMNRTSSRASVKSTASTKSDKKAQDKKKKEKTAVEPPPTAALKTEAQNNGEIQSTGGNSTFTPPMQNPLSNSVHAEPQQQFPFPNTGGFANPFQAPMGGFNHNNNNINTGSGNFNSGFNNIPLNNGIGQAPVNNPFQSPYATPTLTATPFPVQPAQAAQQQQSSGEPSTLKAVGVVVQPSVLQPSSSAGSAGQFKAGHAPPLRGTPASVPKKTILFHGSHYGKNKSEKPKDTPSKKVAFGTRTICVYDRVEDEEDLGKDQFISFSKQSATKNSWKAARGNYAQQQKEKAKEKKKKQEMQKLKLQQEQEQNEQAELELQQQQTEATPEPDLEPTPSFQTPIPMQQQQHQYQQQQQTTPFAQSSQGMFSQQQQQPSFAFASQQQHQSLNSSTPMATPFQPSLASAWGNSSINSNSAFGANMSSFGGTPTGNSMAGPVSQPKVDIHQHASPLMMDPLDQTTKDRQAEEYRAATQGITSMESTAANGTASSIGMMSDDILSSFVSDKTHHSQTQEEDLDPAALTEAYDSVLRSFDSKTTALGDEVEEDQDHDQDLEEQEGEEEGELDEDEVDFELRSAIGDNVSVSKLPVIKDSSLAFASKALSAASGDAGSVVGSEGFEPSFGEPSVALGDQEVEAAEEDGVEGEVPNPGIAFTNETAESPLREADGPEGGAPFSPGTLSAFDPSFRRFHDSQQKLDLPQDELDLPEHDQLVRAMDGATSPLVMGMKRNSFFGSMAAPVQDAINSIQQQHQKTQQQNEQLQQQQSVPLQDTFNIRSSSWESPIPEESEDRQSKYRSFPAGRRYSYGHGDFQDLSADAVSCSLSSTSESQRQGGAHWELFFFRLMHLDEVGQTLEAVLTDDELFEAAEVYLSSVGSGSPSGKDLEPHNQEHEWDEAENREERELYYHDVFMKLQLLRGWKRFLSDQGESEQLVLGLEEVIGLSHDHIMENLVGIVQYQTTKLQEIFEEVSDKFVVDFVLSDDFASFFETHSAVKSHNKRLKIDSKSWLGKFQKATMKHNFPIHLFPFGGGKPFANAKMRQMFGQMCDAPTPREYVDGSTDASTIEQLNVAMKTGLDTTIGVICRTLKQGKPPVLLKIKHLHSSKQPEQIKYTMVIVQDMSAANAELQLKILNAIIEAIPKPEDMKEMPNPTHNNFFQQPSPETQTQMQIQQNLTPFQPQNQSNQMNQFNPHSNHQSPAVSRSPSFHSNLSGVIAANSFNNNGNLNFPSSGTVQQQSFQPSRNNSARSIHSTIGQTLSNPNTQIPNTQNPITQTPNNQNLNLSTQIPPSLNSASTARPPTSLLASRSHSFTEQIPPDNPPSQILRPTVHAPRVSSLDEDPQDSKKGSFRSHTVVPERRFSYGQGVFLDLSAEQASAMSSSTEDPEASKRPAPKWELFFFRLLYLDDINQTLEFILTDEEMYDSVETYVTNLITATEESSIEQTKKDQREIFLHEVFMKLQLLRAWKRFLNEDGQGRDLLWMGFEDVMGLDRNDYNDIQVVIEEKKDELEQMFSSLAKTLVIDFILSSEFEEYHSTHSRVKSHNKRLKTDSKSWLGKFQKATQKHGFPIHLFPFGGGKPFANKKMRKIFGQTCDAPTPREYIDNSTHPAAIEQLLSCMRSGVDTSVEVVCRNTFREPFNAIIKVCHFRSFVNPQQIKFTMVIVQDVTKENSQEQLMVLNSIVNALPENPLDLLKKE